MAEKKTEWMLGSYDANGNYVDPYWVTFYDWFTGKNLNNADTEKSAYWDDSTLATYNTGNNKWGTNDKYTWENTRNTYTWYNADIKTADLDPDYQYGWLAQQQESIDNSYIANRNDNIASALYNEWRRSIEDVADFLNQQAWFQNSTAEQRQNTINSVWKRIGQIEAQNQQNNAEQPQPNENPQWDNNDARNSALNNMESDLNKSTAWELYGKVTADQSTAIKTLEDENSVYRSMNASRIQTFKNLQSMDSNSIASAIISWVMATDTQAMRDLMQYDPAKYQEVKQAEKQIRGQMNINTITSGEWEWNTTATNWQSGISNEITDFAINNSNSASSTAQLLNSINSTLDSNVVAWTAQEQMWMIEADMATLQNRMKNLKKEASTVFKWDVPQYIVNAYIANRTAEIQDQLSILENRYNAAYSRYQNEVKQAQWQAEFWLKQKQLEIDMQAQAMNNYFKQQWIDIQWAELAAKYNGVWTVTTPWWAEVPTTALSQEQVWDVVDNLVQQCTNWTLWNAQCAAWVQKNYFSQLWIEISNLSSWERKKAICTDLASSGYIPKKWDVVALDTGASYTDSNWNRVTAWHMWIVVWVEWDTLKYLDWNGSLDANWKWTETAKVRTIKLSNSKIYGYYNPLNSQQVSFNPDVANVYSELLNKWLPAWTKQAATLKALWLDPNDSEAWEKAFAQANSWKESQKDNWVAMDMLKAIEYLMSQSANKWQRQLAINNWKKTWWIWDIFGSIDRTFRWDAADYNTYYNYIRDNMTLDHLVELKNNGATFWALSDNELRAIWNAAMALSPDMTWAEFNTQLYKIYNKLRKNVWERELSKAEFDSMINAEDEWDRSLYLSMYRAEWDDISTDDILVN